MTQYREAQTSGDRTFVISTWSSSYKNSHYAGLIASEDWPAVMHAQIGKLLDRPGTRAIVAYDRPNFLYGHIVGDVAGPLPVIHYVYVKEPYRSQEDGSGRSGPRHARGLFRALGVDLERPFLYTCKTATAVRLADKMPRAKFAPAAMRYANYQEHRR